MALPVRNALAAGCLFAALALPLSAESLDTNLASVNAALQAGQADKALSLLSALPGNIHNNAQAQNLACRIHFTLGQWDLAVRECEEAVRLEPHNSRNHLWLARSLGEKANKANFISAFSLAKHVAAEFEQAAKLDPQDAEALADLGTFYVEAPSVVGGGIDKAQDVIKQLDRIDPARAYELRAQIDAQHKDYSAAENNLKKAVSISHHPAFQWTNLARFYAERKRWDEMEAAIQSCIKASAHDPHTAVALYDGAGILYESKRDPALAAKMLRDYIADNSKTEEAPTFVAYSRLALLEQQLGDTAGAENSKAAAFQLAREYRPEQDLRR
jgi:predicted Zn-dependent protease